MMVMIACSALPRVTAAGAGAIYAIRFEVLRVLPMMAKVTRFETSPSSSSSKGTMHSTLSREEFLSFRSAFDSAKQRVIDSIEQADEMRLEAVLEDLDCDEDIADALMVTMQMNMNMLNLYREIDWLISDAYTCPTVDREGRGGGVVCDEGEVSAGVAAAHPVPLPVLGDEAGGGPHPPSAVLQRGLSGRPHSLSVLLLIIVIIIILIGGQLLFLLAVLRPESRRASFDRTLHPGPHVQEWV